MIANIQEVNRAGLHRPALAVLRTVGNAWPTSRRFQEVVNHCPFCNLRNGDDLEHLLECPTVLKFLQEVRGPGFRGSERRISHQLMLLYSMPKHVAICMAAIVDCILQSYHAIRARPTVVDPGLLLQGRWHELCRAHRCLATHARL